MNFSTSAIIAGLLFGAIGLAVFRIGRKEANLTAVGFGIALMAYPYFVENNYLLWGLGSLLSYLSYRSLKS